MEWFFDVNPHHAAVNKSRQCKCIPPKKGAPRLRWSAHQYALGDYKDVKHRMKMLAMRDILGSESPLYPDGPVRVEVRTRGQRVHRQGPAIGQAQIDADATTKCVLDALNGVAYTDDSQVEQVVSSKTTQGPVGIWVRVYRAGEEVSNG